MDVTELYQEIMDKGLNRVQAHEEYIDPCLDQEDLRMGITLLFRPTTEIKERIEEIEERIRAVEPNQYFYVAKDYHITLLDILTGRNHFNCTEDLVARCEDFSQKVIGQAKPFKVQLKGLVLSPGAVMVKGFYEDEMEQMRQKLRAGILDHGMKLDERYPTISSHITIVRFRKELEHRKELIQFVQDYQEYDFGTFTVSDIDLVCHNWYDSRKELLKRYTLV